MGWTVQGLNPGGGEIFRTCPDRAWAHHPASCTMGTGSFLGVKSGRGVTLTPHPLLVPWSRKGRAIPLLPVWAVWPVQSLSACTRVTFTFFFPPPTCLLVCMKWLVAKIQNCCSYTQELLCKADQSQV